MLTIEFRDPQVIADPYCFDLARIANRPKTAAASSASTKRCAR
jgi:hypothetical protein